MKIKLNKKVLEEEGNDDIGCFLIIFVLFVGGYIIFKYPLYSLIGFFTTWIVSILIRLFKIKK